MSVDPILGDFERLLASSPGRVVVSASRRCATVAELDVLARAAGSLLAGPRYAPRRLVVVSAPNGPGFLASVLAVRRRGLVPVFVDAAAPTGEVDRIAARLSAVSVLRCRAPWPDGPDDWSIREEGGAPTEVDGIDYVKLTSGSTGEPSGIGIAAAALAADDDALTATMGLERDDVFLAAIPMSHSYGLSSLALPSLRRGVRLVLPDGIDPWSPLRAAADAGATFFPTVPAYLQALLGGVPAAWPASVRLVISAGAPLSATTAERFRKAFGPPVHVFYGASEVGGICYDREGTAGERGTVGTPVDGVSVTLRDEDGRAAPEGRVSVRSPAAATRLLPDADGRLASGEFASADLGAWTADGELRLLGRSDAWINVDGRKVNPREVESVLSALPGVREAVVVGVRAPDSDKEIVRAVVARDPGRLSYDEVVAWCRARLARHKVPRSVVLVDEIPRTDRGKLDRSALRGVRYGTEA